MESVLCENRSEQLVALLLPLNSKYLAARATLRILECFLCKLFEEAALAECVKAVGHSVGLSEVAFAQRTH